MSKTMKRIELNVDTAPPKVDESKGKYDNPELFADKLSSIIQHDDVNNDVDVKMKDMKEISRNLVGECQCQGSQETGPVAEIKR